jgi:site-specific recombinase XerD
LKFEPIFRISTDSYTTWEEALWAFRLNREAQGFAKRTIDDYVYHIPRFFTAHPRAWTHPEKARSELIAYLAADPTVAAATYNIRLRYIKAFFSWCVEEGLYSRNPAQGIRQRKAEPRIVQHDADTLKRLLDAPDRHTYEGNRDRALLHLSLDCAIRPREALSLVWDDVDLNGHLVTVRAANAKTRRTRVLPISAVTTESLGRLKIRTKAKWKADHVFLNFKTGEPLSPGGWTQRLSKAYAKKAGLERLSSYDLRHDSALQAVRNGMSSFALRQLMGHESISTTQIYVSLSEGDMKTAHATSGPLTSLLGDSDKTGRPKRCV